MEMAESHVHDAEFFLDSQGEDAWQQIRRQFELTSGFWLGFVFWPITAYGRRASAADRADSEIPRSAPAGDSPEFA